jgi:IS30 family transposase
MPHLPFSEGSPTQGYGPPLAGWSAPTRYQQIAAWLRVEHPNKLGWHVCHETIYQALYYGGKGGLSRTLTKRLRTGRPLRKRRRRAIQRQIRFVEPAVLLDARPPVVELRNRIGDWEGDLERHEAPWNRAEVKGLRRCSVAAA